MHIEAIRDPRRPEASEYAEFYAGYIALVPDGDIIDVMRQQLRDSLEVLQAVPKAKDDYRYAPGKWSTREVLAHIIDIEWIFTYRALRFARGDQTALAGADQDMLMAEACPAERTLPVLLEELRTLRQANIVLFSSFDDAALDRVGTASGYTFTTRAMLYALVGHCEHHMRVLKEKYL